MSNKKQRDAKNYAWAVYNNATHNYSYSNSTAKNYAGRCLSTRLRMSSRSTSSQSLFLRRRRPRHALLISKQ